MIEQLLVIALAAAFAGWALKPLLAKRRRHPAAPSQAERAAEELLEAKQSVYRSIVDLELDHSMGKIDEGTFAELRRRDRAEALRIIRRLDGTGSESQAQRTLEDEIRAARARLRRQ